MSQHWPASRLGGEQVPDVAPRLLGVLEPSRLASPIARPGLLDRLQRRLRRTLEEWRPYRWPLFGGLLGLFCDLLSKDLAAMLLPGRGPLELAWGVRLLHRANPGMMMGLLADAPDVLRQPLVSGLAAFSLLCVPALVGFLVPWPRMRAWAVALISAGALGNLLERLWRGEVVDFLQVGPSSWHLPAFNLADLEILTGSALVVLALGFVRRAARPRADDLHGGTE